VAGGCSSREKSAYLGIQGFVARPGRAEEVRMQVLRSRPLWTAVLAGCLCASGCGGSDEPHEAPGAPIKVPSLSGTGGKPLSEVQPELVRRIKKQCGGHVCVNVVVRYEKTTDPGQTGPPAETGAAGRRALPCAFRRAEPGPGATVDRGGTIYLHADPPDAESQAPRPCGVDETVAAQPSGGTTAPTGEPSEDSSAPTPDTPGPTEDTGPQPPEDEDQDQGPEPEPPPEDEST
jgi:hypothetical protein